jgi:very-short-patch-repair endonuclease
VKFEREKIVLNGDRFVLLDLWLPKWNLVLELDGFGHLHQKRYDHERSMWLARVHNMKIVRFFNAQVLNGQAEVRVREILGLTPASS